MKKIKFENLFLFIFFLLFNIIIRIGTYSELINDSHSYRQTDTYAMIILLKEKKMDIFHPKLFQALNAKNVEHYFLAELPIYQLIVVILYAFLGENLIIARFVNVFFSSLICFSVYLIGKKIYSKKIALIASIILTLFPLFLFWGRAITSDILALAALTCSFVFLLFIDNKKFFKYLIISSFFISISILIKPFYLAFIFVHYFLIILQTKDKPKKALKKLFIIYLLPVILFMAWRLWFLTFPETARLHPRMSSLMHADMGYLKYWNESDHILVFFDQIFMDRLTTPFGGLFSIAMISLLIFKKKKNTKDKILISWLISCILITLVVSDGTHEHDYYSLHWLPLLALLIADGFESIFNFYFKRMKLGFKISSEQLFSIIFSLVLFCILLYYLAFRPFIFFKNFYFGEEIYANNMHLNSELFRKDYRGINRIIPEDKMVVVFIPEYHPLPLNEIKRFGYIYGYEEYDLCDRQEPIDIINDYRAKKTDYLMLLSDSDLLDCLYEKHPDSMSILDEHQVFTGNYFLLYDLKDL